MKRLLYTSLLLFAGFHALAQSIVVGPAVRRPTVTGTYTLSRNAVTGYLELTPKTGSPFLVRIGQEQIYRLTQTLDSLRLLSKPRTYQPTVDSVVGLSARFTGLNALYRPIGYVPAFSEITSKPTAYNSTIALVPGLLDSLLNRPTNDKLSALITNSVSSTAAYPSATVDQLLSGKANLSTTNTALNQKPTLATLTQIRSYTGTLPGAFERSEPGRSGLFLADAGDVTTADDSVLNLVVQGVRYKRDLPDKRVTPQMYNAAGTGTGDDWAAMQKLFNVSGNTVRVTKGTYRLGNALTRIAKGSIRIEGDGQGEVIFEFFNDTDGIRLVNPINTINGVIELSGITIRSTGPKSAGRRALVVTTQHEQTPSAILSHLNFQIPTAAANDWTTLMDLSDCTGTSVQSITAKAFSVSVTTAIRVYATTGRPSVEHNWQDLHIQNVKYGFDTFADAFPGVEGIHISNGFVVGCLIGFRGRSTGYQAPELSFSNFHINSFGGECFYTTGFSQLAFANCLFYANTDVNTGVTPTHAVYIKDAIDASGFITTNTFGPVLHQVYLDGATAGWRVKVNGICDTGLTNILTVGANTDNIYADASRLWSGAFGSLTGKVVNDLSGKALVPLHVATATISPADKSFLRYNTTTLRYEPVLASPNVVSIQALNATATLDPSTYNLFQLFGGSSAFTLSVDYTKLTTGQIITFKRYDNANSTGTVTIQTTDPTNHLVQNESGVFGGSYSLPTTAGQRQVRFYYNGTNLEFLGY